MFKSEDRPTTSPLDHSGGEFAYAKGTLGICEGNCNIDNHCQEGLVCFVRTDEPVPGCTGSPKQNFDYCIYPQLKNTVDVIVIDSSTNTGSFLRIRDSGALTVFKSDGTVIWDTKDDMKKTDILFDSEFDISPQDASLHFAGTYRHSEIRFNFDSDANKGGFHVKENDIEVFSTTSIAYKLFGPYTVSLHSMLSFDITLANDIEAIAICVDDGVKKRTDTVDEGEHRAVTRCLAIGGTAIGARFGVNIKILDPPAEPEKKLSVHIPLSELFPSRLSKIGYIGIMQVATSEASVTDDKLTSLIQNIDISNPAIDSKTSISVTSDADPCNISLSTRGSACTLGCMAATTKKGLHHELQNEGDFCTTIEIMLTQITKNEEEPCHFDEQCRSGLCQDNTCSSNVSAVVTYVLNFVTFNTH